jgi:ABC-type nitrate/sulfonate/bicarbonate transport system substrate-binding protein
MSILRYKSAGISRWLVGIGAALGLAALLGLALLPRHTEVTVRLALPGWTRSAPFYVALDQGFFRRERLRVGPRGDSQPAGD